MLNQKMSGTNGNEEALGARSRSAAEIIFTRREFDKKNNKKNFNLENSGDAHAEEVV